MGRDHFLYEWTISALAGMPIHTRAQRQRHAEILDGLARAMATDDPNRRTELLSRSIDQLEIAFDPALSAASLASDLS